jgi:pullulanase-type alpha-1,6-glucosidase
MKNRGFVLSAARTLFGFLLIAVLAACGHSSSSTPAPVVTGVPANTMRVHYHRNDGAYSGWGVYSWLGPVNNNPVWPTPNFVFSTNDPDGWGEYVDIPMNPSATSMSFLIITSAGGGAKDTPGDMSTTFPSLATKGADIWILSGDPTVYTAEPTVQRLSLSSAKAVWLAPDTIVWPGSTGATFKLYTAANGGISSDATGVTGSDHAYDLAVTTSISSALQATFPQFASAPGLTVPGTVDLAAALKGQLAVVSLDSAGKIIEGTSLQFAPVLDAVYASTATSKSLGISFAAGVPTFALWAPTAQTVTLNVYPNKSSNTATAYPMTLDAASGVWSYTAADASWTNTAYYDFSVKVFSRAANNAVVTNEVTDPYSVSLNANSQHSMVLDLADPTTAPSGWPGTLLPTSATPTDSVIYELHIRDFSAYNNNANAGKYLAFTESSPGMTHLATLASAGLTHIHLLPTFDIASVDEVNSANPAVPTSTGAGLGAETYLTTAVSGAKPQDTDWFNWGYDPWHYGAPEGSYASDPTDGSKRVMEFRQMVKSLHDTGLRVIMDVVYNHTSAAGQNPKSVLDRIVPGYYFRLDGNGNVEADSCCNDTATEFAMMEKLMTDTLVRWADQYKVDGFRFDIMGFTPKPAIQRALAAVNAVTAADGRGSTYFYGEGWNFGHAQNDALFVQATQKNMGGTGIGTFNDRIRDAVRGGGPFDSGAAVVTNQGFINGLYWDNNDGSAGTAAQDALALAAQNRISLSLAGNLAAFPLNGSTLGSAVDYGGQPTGYTASPQENIAYVSAHDNETIWDISQYKHPTSTSSTDRARAQVVALSTVLLSNGVPFIHAGDDLLRSKSEDSNSYNSGDYFNRIYWDGSSNNWAVGAPPQNTGNNVANLTQEQAVLANSSTAVSGSTINAATLAFQDFLKIRKDSTMFHLATAADIIGNVRFPDQGLGQQPGVIVMQVGDGTSSVGDNKYASALIVFNATKAAKTVTYPWYAGRSVALHPVQQGSADATVASATFTPGTGAFTVPARTTAVFVEAPTNSFTGTFPTMYVRGEMNGWGTTNPMKRVAPNTWQGSIQLATGTYGFKFDTGTWATGQNFGDDGQGDNKVSTSGGNCSITAATAGTYVFTFNDSTLAYSVLPPVWFPGAPANLLAKANANSATAIDLTWNATGGATVYTIYRSPDGVAPYVKIGTATTNGYTDTGLVTGTTYFYEVSAANALFVSALSAATSAKPAASGGPTSPYAAMYMNGDWNGWVTGTGAARMTLIANDTWSFTLTGLAAGNIQFKYDTDDNWGTTTGGHCWTASDTASRAMTGTAKVSPTGDQTNITITLPSAGNYTFTFNDSTLAYTCTKN